MKFFKLRDKVRRYAVENKIDKNDWIFEYLDKSLSKTISQLGNLHLLLTFILFSKHKKQKGFIEFQEKVQKSIDSNSHTKEVYIEYTSILVSYFNKKHYFIRAIIFSSITIVGFFLFSFFKIRDIISNTVFQETYKLYKQLKPVKIIYSNLRVSTNAIPFLPETSAMQQYYRKGHKTGAFKRHIG